MKRLLFLSILFFIGVEIRPLQAASAVVGDGTPTSCTEAAFDAALATVLASGDGVVSFNCGGPATIVFTSQKQIVNTNFLLIDGGGEMTLSGGNAIRLFYVANANLDILNITLTHGNSLNGHGGAIMAENNSGVYIKNSTIQNSRTNDGYAGGAILSFDIGTAFPAVTIIDSVIQDNTSTYGAINTVGKLVINNSIIQNNVAQFGGGLSVGGLTEITETIITGNGGDDGSISHGGGLYMTASAEVTVTRGEISYNNVTVGGGIENDGGELTLQDVTLNNNYAGYGGGIYNTGYAYLFGSTLYDNIAESEGGGVSNTGTMVVTNSTFDENESLSGKAAYNSGALVFKHATIWAFGFDNYPVIVNDSNFDPFLYFYSTFVGANTGYLCSGAPAKVSNFSLYNLNNNSCSWLTGAGNILSDESGLLWFLKDNGGPTLTSLPTKDSPAIDGGKCEATVDQRGIARPQGVACDIGAVEVEVVIQPSDYFVYLPFVIK